MAGTSEAERPFIGRPEAVDALRRRIDAVRTGLGTLTVVEGEAGVGKSTLVAGIVEEARAKGMLVLAARAPSLENPPPLLLLRQALASARQTSGAPAAEEPRVSSIAFAPTTARAEPGFGGLGASEGGPESWMFDDRLLEPFSGGAESGAVGAPRVGAQLAAEFLEFADRTSTLVLLEDVHLADEASLRALAHLVTQLGRHPLWLLVTRLPLGNLTGPRRSLLESVERAGDPESVVVRSFTAAEAAEFVRTLEAGGSIPTEDITRWHSQSGGNPQFLEQILRRRGETEASLPASGEVAPEFAEYLARQLPQLAAPEERVLAVASVLGREFPFGLLMRASGEEEERLAEIVQELVGRGLLRERADESLEFRRDDLRGQIYAKLTDARRRLLHRKAAEALEVHAPADIATVYALARHTYLGKMDDHAVAYNRLAGEFAARSFAPLVARQHFERALECLARVKPRDPVAELEVALDLAVQLDRLGELEAAEKLLAGTLAATAEAAEVPASLRAVATVFLARIYSDQGRWEATEKATESLLAGSTAEMSPRTLLALRRLRGETLYYFGRYVESLAEHDAALALATRERDHREVALETVRRANVLGMIPERFEEAVADYRRAIRSLIEQGDNGEAAYALLFLGVVLSQHGRTPEGLEALREARELADKAHDQRRLGWSLFNIADLEREMGHLPEASGANAQAREILTKIGDRYGLVQTQIVEGKIRLQLGDLEKAEVELLEAFRLVRELNIPADEAEVVLRLAETALARGDAAGAAGRFSELRRMSVERLRPDLATDYRALEARLAEGGGAHG